jgi:hypothetical protein
MPKALCLTGAVVAVLLLLVFGADLATTIPFGRENLLIDISMVICALILGFISWTTFRQLQ